MRRRFLGVPSLDDVSLATLPSHITDLALSNRVCARNLKGLCLLFACPVAFYLSSRDPWRTVLENYLGQHPAFKDAVSRGALACQSRLSAWVGFRLSLLAECDLLTLPSPTPPECWDHRCTLLHPIHVFLCFENMLFSIAFTESTESRT